MSFRRERFASTARVNGSLLNVPAFFPPKALPSLSKNSSRLKQQLLAIQPLISAQHSYLMTHNLTYFSTPENLHKKLNKIEKSANVKEIILSIESICSTLPKLKSHFKSHSESTLLLKNSADKLLSEVFLNKILDFLLILNLRFNSKFEFDDSKNLNYLFEKTLEMFEKHSKKFLREDSLNFKRRESEASEVFELESKKFSLVESLEELRKLETFDSSLLNVMRLYEDALKNQEERARKVKTALLNLDDRDSCVEQTNDAVLIKLENIQHELSLTKKSLELAKTYISGESKEEFNQIQREIKEFMAFLRSEVKQNNEKFNKTIANLQSELNESQLKLVEERQKTKNLQNRCEIFKGEAIRMTDLLTNQRYLPK